MRSMKMILKKISGQISFAANRVRVHRAGGAALSSEGQVGDSPHHRHPHPGHPYNNPFSYIFITDLIFIFIPSLRRAVLSLIVLVLDISIMTNL